VKGFFGLFRCTFRLFAIATLACGIAAADTIIAGGIDTTRGEYRVWIKEDGTNSSTYFGDAIELELANNSGTVNRGALSFDLFTNVSLEAPAGASESVASPVNPASAASILDRIALTLPLNGGVSTAAQEPGPQLAGLAQHRDRKLRSRQAE